MPQWTCINGSFVPEEEAYISIHDLSVQRGYGVFDFFRVVNNQPLYLPDHLERFYFSAAHMRLPLPCTKMELETSIRQLIQKNNLPHAGLRLTLTGGVSANGMAIGKPTLILSQQPLAPPQPVHVHTGLVLVTHQHQRQLAHVKTIDYLMAIWLQPMLAANKADDVLYVNGGSITECPRANFFLVSKENIVVTPAEGILQGVTRKKVLALAAKEYKVEVRAVEVQELAAAREIFITSTTKQIMPVRRVNDFDFYVGKDSVTARLSNALQTSLSAFY